MSSYSVSSAEIRMGITNAFETIFSDELGLNHSRRLQAYRRYWLAYFGDHWSYKRDPGENASILNYCRKAVDSHVDFAFSNGFDIVVKDDPSTKENEQKTRDFIRHKLYDTWEKNNKVLWLIEAGQLGGVTGDVFARVSWDRTDLFDDPYARVDIIPSHFCFPEFSGPHGVDRKKIKRLLIVIPTFVDTGVYSTDTGRVIERNLDGTRVTLVLKAELWTSPEIDENGNILKPAMYYKYEDNKLVSKKENILQEIPVVHIPNYPVAGEYYGLSDLADLTELNVELNTKITDVSDIVDYHGSPQTILKGCKLTNLERGANRIWAIPTDADVFNLKLDGDLGAATSHIQFLKQAFMELASCPKHFWGEPLPVSNTSSSAMQLLYLPVMQKRNMKAAVYGAGIQRINRLILRMNEMADSDFSDKMKSIKRNRYRNTVVMPNPMPRDTARELEEDNAELSMGITGRKHILEKRGLSNTQIEERLKEVDDDRENLERLDYDIGVGSGNNSLFRGGIQETRGDKISDSMKKK